MPVIKAEFILGETMGDVFRQAGCPVTLSLGEGLSGRDIEEELKEDESLSFIQVFQDNSGTLAMSSNGQIIEGDITLFTYAKGLNADRLVVQETKKRVALGFTDEAGRFGPKCNAPFDIGGSSFLRWEPLGKEFDEVAELRGNYWQKIQVIQFEMIRE